jgi:hypothetical protein
LNIADSTRVAKRYGDTEFAAEISMTEDDDQKAEMQQPGADNLNLPIASWMESDTAGDTSRLCLLSQC